MPLTATTKQAIMERVRNRLAIISGLAQQNSAESSLGLPAAVIRVRQRSDHQKQQCELLVIELEEILERDEQ